MPGTKTPLNFSLRYAHKWLLNLYLTISPLTTQGHQQGCVAMTTGIFAGLWDVLPCTNKEKYICKHLAEGAVLTPAPQTVPPPKCADGWNQLLTQKFCYKVKSNLTQVNTQTIHF